MQRRLGMGEIERIKQMRFGQAELVRIETLVDEHCQKLLDAYLHRHGR